jgi:hypothetical protein
MKSRLTRAHQSTQCEELCTKAVLDCAIIPFQQNKKDSHLSDYTYSAQKGAFSDDLLNNFRLCIFTPSWRSLRSGRRSKLAPPRAVAATPALPTTKPCANRHDRHSDSGEHVLIGVATKRTVTLHRGRSTW